MSKNWPPYSGYHIRPLEPLRLLLAVTLLPALALVTGLAADAWDWFDTWRFNRKDKRR